MRTCAEMRGDAHHRELVLGLPGAVVVEMIQHGLRIVRTMRPDRRRILTDNRAALDLRRQMRGGAPRLAHDDDVEMLGQ